MSGIRPEWPERSSLTDDLWDLNRRCWNQEPLLRPGISEVASTLRTALAAQEAHPYGTEVYTTADDPMSTSSRKGGASHNSSSFVTLQNCSSPFEGVRYESPRPTVARRLLALCNPRRPPSAAIDERSCADPIESKDSLYDAKFTGWENLPEMQYAPSGSHGFLRRAVEWLSVRRTRSTQNRGGRPNTLSEKQGVEKVWMTLLDLIAATTPGAAAKLNNVPQTSNRRGCHPCTSLKPTMSQHKGFTIGIVCSLMSPTVTCLISCGSNRYMDQ